MRCPRSAAQAFMDPGNRVRQCLLAQHAEVHHARSCGAERSGTLRSKQRGILRGVGWEGSQACSQALCFLLHKGPQLSAQARCASLAAAALALQGCCTACMQRSRAAPPGGGLHACVC